MQRMGRKLAVSFLAVGIATGLQLLAGINLLGSPFLLFFPAVLVSSLYGAGLLAIFLSALSAEYFFVPPFSSFSIAWPEGAARLVFFVASALTIHYIATRLRRTELDLRMKSDALENSLNAFDIVSAEGKFLYVNQTYLRMWGYDSPAEVLGTSPVSHCADPETPARIIAALKATGECNLEFVGRRKDGTTFDVHMWARRAQGPDGQEIYPTTSIDITERKRAENALKEAVRIRDEFISICSHELKTPITSMKLQFQAAQRQIAKGDERAWSLGAVEKRIGNANRQLVRMAKLIEEMLDVSRMGQGELRLNLQSCDLSALARGVVDSFYEQLLGANLSVRAELPENCWIVCDSFRIEQVLSNLISNAMKYGGGTPITVSLDWLGGWAVLTVRDEGEGVSEEHRERIFGPFERAEGTRHVNGLGLGLYISRRIVEAHGGRIWVESATGGGAQFKVELPKAGPDEARSD